MAAFYYRLWQVIPLLYYIISQVFPSLYVNDKRNLLHFLSRKYLIRHFLVCKCAIYYTLFVRICVQSYV